jgi:hypothetical protein
MPGTPHFQRLQQRPLSPLDALAIRAAARAAGLLAAPQQLGQLLPQLRARGLAELDALAALLMARGDVAQAWQRAADCAPYGGAAHVYSDVSEQREVDWGARQQVSGWLVWLGGGSAGVAGCPGCRRRPAECDGPPACSPPQEEVRRGEAFRAAQFELDFVLAKLLEGDGGGILGKVGADLLPFCERGACLAAGVPGGRAGGRVYVVPDPAMPGHARRWCASSACRTWPCGSATSCAGRAARSTWAQTVRAWWQARG